MVDVVIPPKVADGVDEGYWTHIVIEAYCMIDSEYNRTCDKHDYEIEFYKNENGTDDMRFIPVDNKDYNPGAKPDETPVFCNGRKKPGYNCLVNNCIHLSFCEASDKIRDVVRKTFKEEVDAEEKE